MRVLIAADRLGALGTMRAGVALGVAWADLGADVAVVPMGESGSTALGAIADAECVEPGLLPSDVDEPLAVAAETDQIAVVALEAVDGPADAGCDLSSYPLGRALARLLERRHAPATVVVDLAWAEATHDAGAGLLAGMGATSDGDLTSGLAGLGDVTRVDLTRPRHLLRGARLVGLVPTGHETKPLLGLRGLASTRGRAAELDVATVMAADAKLERFAAASAAEAAAVPGAGACGGAGFAIAALGGRILSGPAYCAERAGLAETIRRADLVVTACTSFDFGSQGGGVVRWLAGTCAAAGVPLIVVASDVMIGHREMRSIGIEAAYPVEIDDPTEEQLVAAARAVARTWSW